MSKSFYDSFNGSVNKGYRYAGSLERRKEGNVYGVEKEF